MEPQAFDINGLLVFAKQIGNNQVDPILPRGFPGTVTMEKTGHVLSLPHPELGETFVPYCQRVSEQAHGQQVTVGALFAGTAGLFARFGGFKADGSNWPEAADCFYNLRSYMTEAERKAADEAAASWHVVYERMGRARGPKKHGRDPKPDAPTPDSGEVPL
jgi:hypothetical protein